MRRLLRDSRFWLILILLIGAVLRFYRLSDYLQFLGDEGRDALVVKRMIVDHHWTLLGPTASVGGFYVGPIYYYFMLPFLWAANLNPVGPAVMAAIFGLLTIITIYYFCQLFFNKHVALLAAFLTAISPTMVYISRFSWNPNPSPLFATLVFLCLYLAATKKKTFFSFLAGVSAGIMIQLHYTNLAVVPIVVAASLLIFPLRTAIFQLTFVFLGFLLGNSLYLIFEVRHDFPNIRSVIEFTTRSHGSVISPRSFNLPWLFNDMARRTGEIVYGFAGPVLDLFYLGGLVGFLIWAVRNFSLSDTQRTKVIILGLWLIIGVVEIGSYQGQLLNHYFGYLYPLPLILLALTGGYLLGNRKLWPLLLISFAILIFFEIKNMYFWSPPNKLLEQTQNVDKIVLSLADNQPYNFALLTLGNSDHAYRYFLEIWGYPPVTIESSEVDPKRLTVTSQLIVVCEGSDCKPLGNPLWEVAGFGRGEIVDRRVGPAGIIIYKLVHYTGK